MQTNEGGCLSIKLYLQKQAVGQIFPAGYSLPTPDQDLQYFTSTISKNRNSLQCNVCKE